MAERLRRLEWVFPRSPIYFVSACTHDRRRILANARTQERMIQFAERGKGLGAWLGGFVLMPDHFHAFVALGDPEVRQSPERKPPTPGTAPLQIGNWMQALKRTLSKALLEDGFPNPHWQKGFFDHVLRSEESYSEKWDYVRQNPVRAGLAARAEDWPYFGEPCPLIHRYD